MPLLVLIALLCALGVAVWAVVERSWPLLLLAAAVVLLCLSGSSDLSLHH
jgi:hypothetical protein